MKQDTTETPLGREELAGGALWRVTLEAPKGNILDAAMVKALTDTFREAQEQPGLKAILLGAAGSHFCFGASVEEHRAENVGRMLAGFHELFRVMGDGGLPVLCAVRGVCLGGGLELAAFCQRLVVHPGAKLGQPEIALGVLAPVASAILADRIGRGNADDLLLSGRSVGAEEALAMGLVDEVAEDPEAAVLGWAEEHLVPRSASSLRLASRAARFEFLQRFDRLVADLERLYLDELMATADAIEGIEAFLARREPTWSDS
jgi:cyclohexa-1,5-dienecarbonyl-CoA hydratase